MRARALRLVAAAVAACVAGVSMTAAGEPAGASSASAAAPPLRIEVLEIDASGLDRLIALAGAPHRIDVAVRITNDGTRVERDVVARIGTTASTAATRPFELAPGEAVTTVVAVEVSGLPGAAHDIVASAGDTTVDATHGQVPWLLVGTGALGLHIVVLGMRDRVRAKLARAGALEQRQPSPSHTWARSSR